MLGALKVNERWHMIIERRPALFLAALAVSAGLAGCGTPESMTEPIVSSFNEASVEIQLGQGDMGFVSEEMRAQAVQKADAKAAVDYALDAAYPPTGEVDMHVFAGVDHALSYV